MRKIYSAATIISVSHLLFLISIVLIAYKTCFIDKKQLVGFENLACGIFDPQGFLIILPFILISILPALFTIALGFYLYKNIGKKHIGTLVPFYIFGTITVLQSLFDLLILLEPLID